YHPFKISEEFKRFASIFALGNSYFYIVNLHDFTLDYISESVKGFVDKEVKDIEMEDLLQTLVPEEMEIINLKSRIISDFYTSFLEKDEVLKYKNIFSYRMKDADGKLRTMLYQAFPLSVSENSRPEHVFCIQTDISHLKVNSTNEVSFVHMKGGKCYFNIDISKGEFSPDEGNTSDDFSELLTEREIQVIRKLSRGLKAEQIAEELHVSPHTIKTHRRNILQKSGCTNTTELVAKCLISGIISPGLN
ncbi:MAG: helix-turn-helix transcriptional regulator, partial [Gillisia sp.]